MTSSQSETNNPAFTIAQSFLNLLTEESAHYITTLPASGLLRPAQWRILQKIITHFEPALDEDDSDIFLDVNEDAPSTSQSTKAQAMTSIADRPTGISEKRPGSHHETRTVVPKKRGRPPNASTDSSSKKINTNVHSKSWGAILAVDHFELDPCFQRYLTDNFSENAASFFEPPPPAFDKPDRDHIAEFLRFCCTVDVMEPDDVIDRVRRLFLLVTVGDLAYNIFGPDWSNTKKRELKAIVTNELNADGYSALRKRLILAAQLVFICRNFGTGSLFWLHNQLSDYFLRCKVTQGGDSFQGMMRHVRNIRHPQSSEQRQADRSGDGIRAYLCDKYKIEEKSVAVEFEADFLSDPGSGDGEGSP